MKPLTNIRPESGNPPIQEKVKGKSDAKVMAKEIETVFLNEFMKIMMEQTSFGKDKTVSTFMPLITSEISRSLAERGIGIGDFLTKNSNKMEVTSNFKDSNKLKDEEDLLRVTRHSSLSLSPPVEGRISSGYGTRHDPMDGKLHHHNGIDIAVPEGTPITPAAPGRVVFSGQSGGYGNCVVIEHGNGMTSIYAHNSVNYVRTGDLVDQDKIIALSGSTGKSTGSHVHFEVRKQGSPVDPMGFFG